MGGQMGGMGRRRHGRKEVSTAKEDSKHVHVQVRHARSQCVVLFVNMLLLAALSCGAEFLKASLPFFARLVIGLLLLFFCCDLVHLIAWLA
eukprot:2428189-Amphidinium_carterae.1